jgi:hypothetical protein
MKSYFDKLKELPQDEIKKRISRQKDLIKIEERNLEMMLTALGEKFAESNHRIDRACKVDDGLQEA